MRVLIWSFVPPSPDSAHWHWLKGGMEAVGHQVIAVDAFALAEIFGPRRMQDILLAYARAYRVQAAMVVSQNFVSPAFIRQLRALGVRVIQFRYDDGLIAAAGMPRPHPNYLRQANTLDDACDLSVTICRGAVPLLADAGIRPPLYLPFPFSRQAVSAAEQPQRPVIAYAGSPKYRGEAGLSARVAIVRALLEAGLPVEAHCDGWDAVPGCAAAARPTPAKEDFYQLFRTSTVNLCVVTDGGATIFPVMKGLSLEIAAAGGMQITTRCAEIEDFFTPGTDFAVAGTVAEFVTQARYYLAHPDEARHLGRNSRKALEERGGWDRWWQSVAEHLEAAGLSLDLSIVPDGDLDRTEIPLLAAAATAMAHAHEKAGKLGLAAVYYDEVLRYDPADYSAHCGLARLASSDEAARQHWRLATENAWTGFLVTPPERLDWPGIGPDGSNFLAAAAVNWAGSARRDGDLESMMAAVPIMTAMDPAVGPATAMWLGKRGFLAEARRCLDATLAAWPDSLQAWQLLAELSSTIGDTAMLQVSTSHIHHLTGGQPDPPVESVAP